MKNKEEKDEKREEKKHNEIHPHLCYRKYPSVYIKHLLNNLNVRAKTIHNFLILLRESFGAILIARTYTYTCIHGMVYMQNEVKKKKKFRNPFCETRNSNGMKTDNGVEERERERKCVEK